MSKKGITVNIWNPRPIIANNRLWRRDRGTIRPKFQSIRLFPTIRATKWSHKLARGWGVAIWRKFHCNYLWENEPAYKKCISKNQLITTTMREYNIGNNL